MLTRHQAQPTQVSNLGAKPRTGQAHVSRVCADRHRRGGRKIVKRLLLSLFSALAWHPPVVLDFLGYCCLGVARPWFSEGCTGSSGCYLGFSFWAVWETKTPVLPGTPCGSGRVYHYFFSQLVCVWVPLHTLADIFASLILFVSIVHMLILCFSVGSRLQS